MFKAIVCVLIFLSVVLANETPEFLQASYGYREYFIFTHEVDFVQAYARCKKLGWTFATEQNSDESVGITLALTLVNKTTDEYYLGGINQIYGNDPEIWIWLESAEEISYANWANGEPTDGKDCLLRSSVNSYGNWTSSDCTAAHYFICQPLGQ